MPGSMSPDSDQSNDATGSQRKPSLTEDNHSNAATNKATNNESVPRPKRMACILCRKRKLKCDGNKPSCGTCSRLGHSCEYSEERKKSGPKRGYVKLLEARLKQVENLLENHNVSDSNAPKAADNEDPDRIMIPPETIATFNDITMQGMNEEPAFTDPSMAAMADFAFSSDDYSWEMIGLGLEEALPNQNIIDELNQIYFEKIHPSLPMLHRGRFLAAMDLAPHARPAVCLRYAMWTLASGMSSKYSAYTEHFYTRARKYAEQDEMRGHGENMITIGHPQCWTLLACHEFKWMMFPRAWMSIGRATRLVQMMGLHRQDYAGLDVKQTLSPPRDWIDREERRRTFWMAYCQDRYASIGTGWPMLFDEGDILTNLPASEEAYNRGEPERTQPLSEILNGDGAATLSSFGGVIALATLFGRNLTHLHRPDEKDNDHDLNGEFWKRHRTLDNILLNMSLSMPAALRLPAGIQDPNTVYLNMNIHTATICLHQAAIFKADKNRLPAQISAESKRRCIVAADQITNIMKMISHMDLSMMNPFMAFCLYVAARVFIQYLKSRREDAAIKASLNFLLSAMQVLKIKNPLTESFLVQLDVDLEGSGLDLPKNIRPAWVKNKMPPGEIPLNTDSVKCSPLIEIRQSQQMNDLGLQPQIPRTAATNNPPSNDVDSGLYGQGPSIQINNASDSQQTNYFPNNTMEPFGFFQGQGKGQASSSASPNLFNGSNNDHLSSSSYSNNATPSSSSNRAPSTYAGFSPPQQQQQQLPHHQNNQSSFPSNHNTSNTNVNFANPLSFLDSTSSNPNSTTNPPNSVNNGITTDGNTNVSSSQWTTVPLHVPHPVSQPVQIDPVTPMSSNAGGNVAAMTPGATGMTPLPDSLWQGVNEGNEWIYGWSASTPQ